MALEFELDPADLHAGFQYEWMSMRDSHEAALWGWAEASAKDHPGLPSKDGVVSYGGLVLMMTLPQFREAWARRSYDRRWT